MVAAAPQLARRSARRWQSRTRPGSAIWTLVRDGLPARRPRGPRRAVPVSPWTGEMNGGRPGRLPGRAPRRWRSWRRRDGRRFSCRCRRRPTTTSARTREVLAAAGAAEVIEQRELTGDALATDRRRLLRTTAARLRDDGRAARRAREAGRGARRSSIAALRSWPVSGELRDVLGRTRRIHFVGIGGIGMSGIAELLANLGYAVSGSDARRSDVTDRLAALGVRVDDGHDAGARRRRRRRGGVVGDRRRTTRRSRRRARRQHPGDSAGRDARRADAAARSASRSPARTARPRRRRWSPSMLERAGLDPTAVIGGRLSAFGSNARLGRGDVHGRRGRRERSVVPEAVAGDRRDDQHRPRAHGRVRDLRATRSRRSSTSPNKVPFYGAVVACADDPPVRAMLPRVDAPRRSPTALDDAAPT